MGFPRKEWIRPENNSIINKLIKKINYPVNLNNNNKQSYKCLLSSPPVPCHPYYHYEVYNNNYYN